MASKSTDIYLGIDIGSVTAKLVMLDAETLDIVDSFYTRTHGDPLKALRSGIKRLAAKTPAASVLAAGTTGSGRHLAAKLVNTDIVKNEITTHTLAAGKILPEVQTIVEIGGQDSKIIIVRDKMAVDFAMNTVCAAGTGSFLDQQAGRLGIQVEDMGELALSSDQPASVSGRCTVFAETDMVHKQQIGVPLNDIVAGLCRSLVRNYLASVARGKVIKPPVIFQGGVAANKGIVKEFERQTGHVFQISPYLGVEGAYGAALLAAMATGDRPVFQGMELIEKEFRIGSFVCRKCEEACSVLMLYKDGKPASYWNDRCGEYANRI